MKKTSKHIFKTMLAVVLVAVIVLTSVVVKPPVITRAASTPTLNQATRNILIGKSYDLNVIHKIKNSSYEWSTSNKKVATVTQRGVVTGIQKGKATITCHIKTAKKSYTLTCKVTVREVAKSLKIINKITALNLGQTYDLNRILHPSTSNDKTTWTTSNKKVALPNSYGKFTAQEEGTVTITGTTLSGAKDSVTFTVVDQAGTVTTQKELEKLLGSGVSLITIKTTEAVNFEIPSGDYSKQTLVIDAPNSDITNNGTFSSIEIKQIKADTWYEKAVGNIIRISDSESRIVIATGYSATIQVLNENAKLTIQNNGKIDALTAAKGSEIIITGDSNNAIPVAVTVPNVKIKTSVAINLDCTQKVELTLLKGSENTKVHASSKEVVPSIIGSITIKVTIGSGDSSTDTTIIGTTNEQMTPSSSTPTLPSTPIKDNVFDDLNQSEIVKAMGAGWNLGNQLESVMNGIPNETNWGNPVITEDLIKAVKAAGFKSIRIPVSYIDMIGEGPEYKINKAWLDRVQEIVDYCMDNGLYAIINVHADGYNSVDGGWLLCGNDEQESIKAKYKAVWTQISTRFKDYDEHLVFESMNEVFDGTYNEPDIEHYKNINVYNQIFMDTIRQTGGNNSMRWVLIPGWNTSVEYTVGNYGFEMPTDHYLSDKIPAGEKRIMISVHYYAPWDFCGGESGEITQWGESATNPNKVSTHSGQSVMAAGFKSLYDTFTSKGYPVIIGEYGSIDKTEFDSNSNYYRAYFARKVVENSAKYGCIPVIWDNGWNGKYGFGLFDRTKATVTQPEIIKAIMEAINGSTKTGTSTNITLSQTNITMSVDDEPITLTAALTPTDSKDIITWSSSDETVATVSDSGVVRAYSLGSATITAIVNGYKAECTVNVTPSQNVKVALFALETTAWGNIKSSTNATLSPDGGTYTLTLTGSKDMLSNIGSLYLKDTQVQSGLTSKSLFSNAKIKVDSVKFNGVSCTVTQTTPSEAIGNNGVLDFSILNEWAAGSEKVAEVKQGTSGAYQFTTAPYQDVNTIEVTFTTTDLVKSTDNGNTTTPTTPVVTDTATPISSIQYDFSIEGVTTENSLDFLYTGSDWTEKQSTLSISGDGDYSITINTNNVTSMINLGYFKNIPDSTIKATLNKVTVNGTYELTYETTLDVSSSYQNGLCNIWSSSLAGTKIAEGTNSYIALNDDKTGLIFYVKNK